MSEGGGGDGVLRHDKGRGCLGVILLYISMNISRKFWLDFLDLHLQISIDDLPPVTLFRAVF